MEEANIVSRGRGQKRCRGSQWQHTQPPELQDLGRSPSGMPTLGSLLHELGQGFLLALLLPASFLSQFHCGNETSDSCICAACLGTGDITSTRILLFDSGNWPVIFKLCWLSNIEIVMAVQQESSELYIIPSEEDWKLQSCYVCSLSYSNSFIQSLFASISGDLWIIMFSWTFSHTNYSCLLFYVPTENSQGIL